MRNIQLYIEDQEVDIVNLDAFSGQFAFTYTFNDLYEPDKVTDTYSKEITLPGTSRNNRIFGQCWNLTLDDLSVFDPMQLHHYRLTMDGYLWRSGSVRLNSINVKGSVISYNITLFGTMTGFMSELLNANYDDPENKLLCSLPFSNQLRHTVDKNSVFTRASYGGRQGSYGGLCYVPCNNGLYENFNSEKWLTKNSAGNPVVAPVHFNSKDADGGDLKWDEYQLNEYRSYYQRPAINVWTMLGLIQSSETNYRLSYDDLEFFKRGNPYYYNTVMTCDRYQTDSDAETLTLNIRNGWSAFAESRSSSTGHPYTRPNLYIEIPVESVDGAYDILDDEGWIDPTMLPTGTKNLSIEFEGGMYFVSTNTSITQNRTIRLSSPIRVNVVAMTDNSREYAASAAHNTGTSFDENNNSQFFYENIGRKDYFQPDSYATPFTAYLAFTAERTSYPAWSPENYLSKPMKQELNISAITRKFKLYIKVSDLSDVGILYTGYTRTEEYNLAYLFQFKELTKISLSGTNRSIAGQYGFTGSDVTIDYTENVRSGVSVSKEKILGKTLTQGEFLLRYTKLFGLMYDTDRDGTISIKSRNEYFKDYKILDWSDKVDHSDNISIRPLAFDTKTLSMKYEDGKSYYEDKYRGRFGVDYGEQRINTGYPYNSENKELLEKNFTNTVIAKDTNEWIETIGGITTKHTMAQYPLPAYYKKEDEGRKEAYGGNTLLFFKGNTLLPDGKRIAYTDDSDYMYDENIGGGEEPCWTDWGNGVGSPVLSYGIPEYTTLWSPTVSLDLGYPLISYAGITPSEYLSAGTVYSRFWANYISEIYSKNSKVVTMHIHLTPDDIFNFSFKNFVVIDNVLYHPNKLIDLNPLSEGTTEVELIKVTNIENYTNGQNLNFD